MPGYQGSLFDANGPAQFAQGIQSVADALDQVSQKASSFLSVTQQGLDNLTTALNNFSAAGGTFSGGGMGGGGGGRGGGGGTGGQGGNTMGVGGSGNTPPVFQSQVPSNTPNGGQSSTTLGGSMASRGAEAAVGVATGFAQNYISTTQTPAIQQQMAAVQMSLASGQSLHASMFGIANSNLIAANQGDLAVGAATMQNTFGVPLFGSVSPQQSANASMLTGSANIMSQITGSSATQSMSSMGSMISNSALMSQLMATGTSFRSGGSYTDLQTLAQDYFQRMNMAQMPADQFQQSLMNGNIFQTLMNMTGGNAQDVETMQRIMQALYAHPGTTIPANATTSQLVKMGLISPAAASQMNKASAQAHVQAQTAQGQDQVLTQFNNAMTDFYQSVNKLFGSNPGLATFAGGASQSLSSFGPLFGSLLGMGNTMGGSGGGGGAGPLGDVTGLLGGGGGGAGPLGEAGGLLGGGGGLMAGGIGALAFGVPALLAMVIPRIPKLVTDMSKVYDKAASAIGSVVSSAGSAAASGLSAIGSAIGSADSALSSGASDIANGALGFIGIGGGSTSSSTKTSSSSSTQANTTAAVTSSSGISSKNPYWSIVQQAAGKYGVDPKLLSAQEFAESGWNPAAVSPTGAFGISQFEPGTAAEYGVQRGTSQAAITSQIMGQAAYMAALLKQFGVPDNALAAYNAGPNPANWKNSQTTNYVAEINRYLQIGQYDRGTYEVPNTGPAILHKGERVIRSADNTVSSRYGNESSSTSSSTHVHYHLSPGAIAVTMPSTDSATAKATGNTVAEALMSALAKA